MKNKKIIQFMVTGALLIGGSIELLKTKVNDKSETTISAKEIKHLDVKAFTIPSRNTDIKNETNLSKKFKSLKRIRPQASRHRAVLDLGNPPAPKAHNFNKKKTAKKANKKTAKKKNKKKSTKDKLAKLKLNNDQEKNTTDMETESNFEDQPVTSTAGYDDTPIVTTVSNNQDNSPQVNNTNDDQANDDENKVAKSFEEWSELLLNKPSPKHAAELAALFNDNKVSRETFYKLTEAMIESDNIEISKLGIKTTADARNFDSFVILSDYITANNGDQQNITYAQELVDSVYTKANRIPVLKNILTVRTTDEASKLSIVSVQTLALNTLTKSAQINIGTENRVPNQLDDENKTNQDTLNQYVSAYRSMIPVIEKVINESQGTLKQTATNTKNRLNSLLAPYNNNPEVITAGL